MLVGCLAIIGAGLPFVFFGDLHGIGLSGFYSKDAIIEQALSVKTANAGNVLLSLLFYAPAFGAAITGVLHVPHVVHDLHRAAARSARLRPRSRVAAEHVYAAGGARLFGDRRWVEFRRRRPRQLPRASASRGDADATRPAFGLRKSRCRKSTPDTPKTIVFGPPSGPSRRRSRACCWRA